MFEENYEVNRGKSASWLKIPEKFSMLIVFMNTLVDPHLVSLINFKATSDVSK